MPRYLETHKARAIDELLRNFHGEFQAQCIKCHQCHTLTSSCLGNKFTLVYVTQTTSICSRPLPDQLPEKSFRLCENLETGCHQGVDCKHPHNEFEVRVWNLGKSYHVTIEDILHRQQSRDKLRQSRRDAGDNSV